MPHTCRRWCTKFCVLTNAQHRLVASCHFLHMQPTNADYLATGTNPLLHMKAAVSPVYGPPTVLQIQEVPMPAPKPQEMLIKIAAATVNRTDSGFLTGKPYIVRPFSGFPKPKNKVLGNEFAGEVVAVGEEVTKFKEGDRVFGYNDVSFGCHAQYICMAQNAPIAHIPHHFSYSQAAALSEGAHYALCDIRAAKVTAGQKVLVNGATGAIGSAAVQIMKAMGCEVTAVCPTNYVATLYALGADRVIDYTQQDFTQLAETFHFVFDAVGKSTFGKCKRILSPKGIYISTEFGPWIQNPFWALTTPLFGGKKLLFPLPTVSQQDIEYLANLATAKQFTPLIDRHFALHHIAEAYQYVLTGQKKGNVIIDIPHQ